LREFCGYTVREPLKLTLPMPSESHADDAPYDVHERYVVPPFCTVEGFAVMVQ
jgi:hypothetical protein